MDLLVRLPTAVRIETLTGDAPLQETLPYRRRSLTGDARFEPTADTDMVTLATIFKVGSIRPNMSIYQKNCSPEETTSYKWERTIHILSLPRSLMPAKIMLSECKS